MNTVYWIEVDFKYKVRRNWFKGTKRTVTNDLEGFAKDYFMLKRLYPKIKEVSDVIVKEVRVIKEL